MIRPNNGTENLLVSPNKMCEKLIKEIHTKLPETLECKLTKPREFFPFKPFLYLGLDSNWIVGLTSFKIFHFFKHKRRKKQF